MKTTANTILITGGSAGIGFELAKQFSKKGNHVIITGRNAETLNLAASKLKNVTPVLNDVTKEEDLGKLVKKLSHDFPNLNVVINNAGKVHVYKLSEEVNSFSKASEEILTNYLSIVKLNEALLPLLSKQHEAAIVNVSSIVAFVPSSTIPTYSASKAALHSYTQSLRIALKGTSVKVFELMPPLVNTEFSKEIGGSNGIAPEVVANDLITALENDQYEVHVGNTENIYQLSLSSPAEALSAMNQR